MFHPSRRAVVAAGLAAGAIACTGLPAPRASADGGRLTGPPGTTDDPDLVFHTSFEDPTETVWLSDSTTFDTNEHITGLSSLKYTRTNVDSYTIVKHPVPFEPGKSYQISGFIKTSGINTIPRQGASFALEAYDANGKWIRGAYAVGSVSTEWELRTAVFDQVPANTATLYAAFYIYRKQLGTAWFDEITVRRPTPAVLTTSLRYPNYRGMVIPGETSEIDLSATINLDLVDASTHELRFTLTGGANQVIDQRTVPLAASQTYRHPTSALAIGDHTLQAAIVSTATGAITAESSWPVRKVSSAPASYLDSHGRLIRNGTTHFPIGFYASTVEDSLPDITGTPFNTLLAYRPPTAHELDLAQAAGKQIIYSLAAWYFDTTGAYFRPPELVTEADEVPQITQRVELYRDHPALLAWYLSDELPVDYYGQRMIAHQDAVVAADSAHPTLAVSPTALAPETYQRATDVLGVDNYPVTGQATDDLATPGRLAVAAAQALPNRGQWHVAQYFNWEHYGRVGRFPSRAELRSMCWQYLVAGATGLLIYQAPLMHTDPDHTFDELMSIASDIATEILGRVPVMLATDRVPDITSDDVPGLMWTTRRHDNQDHIVAVSCVTTSTTARFTCPTAMSIDVIDENRQVPVASDGTFTDAMAGLDLHLYRVVPPTFATLADLTRFELEQVAGPGHRGVTSAATHMLERAAMRSTTESTDSLLSAYGDLIREQRGSLLDSDTVDNLVRLANVLTN